MNIEKIKKIYVENKKVSFNLLGLDYTIEEKNDGVIIYEDMYKLKYKFFNNIDTLLENYYIYGEELSSYDIKIKNIN